MSQQYLNNVYYINKKMEEKRPMLDSEIAKYFGIEERIVRNIFFMFHKYGRDAVESITLTDDEIDDIIRMKYPLYKRKKSST